jgi:hypothetical protein
LRGDRYRLAGSPQLEGPQVTWVIEYVGFPSCWIAERAGVGAAFDVTFQRPLAKKFMNREDASCEILRLGLSNAWFVQELRSWLSSAVKIKGGTD